jgi:putative transposase
MIPPFPLEFSPLRLATNTLGRRDCEVKRGSHFIGIFPKNAAFVRLVPTLLLDKIAEWSIAHRYVRLATHADVNDIRRLRLSAIAA